LRPWLDLPEFKQLASEAASLDERILARYAFLKSELERPGPELLAFKDGIAGLTGWRETEKPANGQMDQTTDSQGIRCLWIVTKSDCAASWRTRAVLGPGRYRFEGKVAVREVKPLQFGSHQGAGLRITGETRQSPDIIGTSSWKLLTTQFQVPDSSKEVEFVCELRASSGEAWFDLSSVRVVKLNEP
jgi:hypothetical protein